MTCRSADPDRREPHVSGGDDSTDEGSDGS